MGDNWSYKTGKTPENSANEHPTFYRSYLTYYSGCIRSGTYFLLPWSFRLPVSPASSLHSETPASPPDYVLHHYTPDLQPTLNAIHFLYTPRSIKLPVKHTLTLPPSYLRIHSFIVILLFSLHLFLSICMWNLAILATEINKYDLIVIWFDTSTVRLRRCLQLRLDFDTTDVSDVNPCPCPWRSSPWQVVFLNLACNTHSIVLMVIYLFSVMGFTVIRCELSLCVHCCCLIAIEGLAATCSK